MKHTISKILLSLLFLAPVTLIAMNNDTVKCNVEEFAVRAKKVHAVVAKKVLEKYNSAYPDFYYEERPDLDDAVSTTKFADLLLKASSLTVPELDLPQIPDADVPRNTYNRLNILAQKYLEEPAPANANAK